MNEYNIFDSWLKWKGNSSCRAISASSLPFVAKDTNDETGAVFGGMQHEREQLWSFEKTEAVTMPLISSCDRLESASTTNPKHNIAILDIQHELGMIRSRASITFTSLPLMKAL